MKDYLEESKVSKCKTHRVRKDIQTSSRSTAGNKPELSILLTAVFGNKHSGQVRRGLEHSRQ